MPKLKIERSIKINAPVALVYAAISDFNKWVVWSPWLLMEPEAKVDIADDAKSYKWEGDRVGAGNMKVLEERENEYLHCDLNFLKPWKSANTTSFYLTNTNEGTEVKWTMDTS
ncbi:MAG: SRPBCC family protein, partial [Ekhidna sp.]